MLIKNLLIAAALLASAASFSQTENPFDNYKDFIKKCRVDLSIYDLGTDVYFAKPGFNSDAPHYVVNFPIGALSDNKKVCLTTGLQATFPKEVVVTNPILSVYTLNASGVGVYTKYKLSLDKSTNTVSGSIPANLVVPSNGVVFTAGLYNISGKRPEQSNPPVPVSVTASIKNAFDTNPKNNSATAKFNLQ